MRLKRFYHLYDTFKNREEGIIERGESPRGENLAIEEIVKVINIENKKLLVCEQYKKKYFGNRYRRTLCMVVVSGYVHKIFAGKKNGKEFSLVSPIPAHEQKTIEKILRNKYDPNISINF